MLLYFVPPYYFSSCSSSSSTSSHSRSCFSPGYCWCWFSLSLIISDPIPDMPPQPRSLSHVFDMCLSSPFIYLHMLAEKENTKYHLYELLWCTLMTLGYRVHPDSSLSRRVFPMSPSHLLSTLGSWPHVTHRRPDDGLGLSCGLKRSMVRLTLFLHNHFSSGILTLLALVCLTQ